MQFENSLSSRARNAEFFAALISVSNPVKGVRSGSAARAYVMQRSMLARSDAHRNRMVL